MTTLGGRGAGFDRRTFLVGAAGLLASACSGGGGSSDPAATSKGPNIVRPDAGTVVTPDDTAALAQQLNAALEARDVDALVKVIDPEDFALADVRKRWTRRFDNFQRVPVTGEWYVGVPAGRTRNAAGGKVEYSGNLVFAHQIDGCDGQQVVETYRADFRKASEDAPLELLHVGEPEESYDPSFWDVAEIDVIETPHAYVAFRTKDAKTAKSHAARIEAGAKRAFAVMPDPRGVDKIFYALTWPQIDGRLYGGVAVGDADAHAYYHPFVDPAELAKGQKTAASGKGLPKATGRAGLHQASLSRADFVEVAAHEGVHVLANPWYGGSGTPTWAVEGLATWGEAGAGALMSRDGGRIRSYFRSFEPRALKDYAEFHDGGREYEMYACSAAVYAYLEDQGGKDAVFEVAEAFYGSEGREAGAKALGRSEKDLFAATRTWLGA